MRFKPFLETIITKPKLTLMVECCEHSVVSLTLIIIHFQIIRWTDFLYSP